MNRAMLEVESFTLDDLPDELFWPFEPLEHQVPVTQVFLNGAFVPYTKPREEPLGNQNLIKRPNVHNRMIEFLRTIPTNRSNSNTSDESREFENDRSYKHMMNERQRREKQKNTYNALHSHLPPGTKNEKNSVLKMSAMLLRELENTKKHLQKRNQELEKNVLSTSGSDTMETDTFRLRRQTPPSGMDSMIAALRTMKKMGLKARSIQCEFSNTEFFAVLEIEQKIEAVMVENAVEKALEEVEMTYEYDVMRECDVMRATEWCPGEGDIWRL